MQENNVNNIGLWSFNLVYSVNDTLQYTEFETRVVCFWNSNQILLVLRIACKFHQIVYVFSLLFNITLWAFLFLYLDTHGYMYSYSI